MVGVEGDRAILDFGAGVRAVGADYVEVEVNRIELQLAAVRIRLVVFGE